MQALIDSQSVLSATGRPAWKALTAHYQKIRKRHLRDMFLESDVERTLGHDSSTDALIRRYRKLKEPL